jgi:riboflavin synthase
MARNEAIKQIADDLRTENHPWRAADLVRKTLVAAGRGGRSGRPSRGES